MDKQEFQNLTSVKYFNLLSESYGNFTDKEALENENCNA